MIAGGSSVVTGSDLNVFADGTININNGGVVTTNGNGRVADAVIPGDGTVSIDGAGSEWNIAGELRVGVDGKVIVDVTRGGSLTSNGGFIGDFFGTRLGIDGADSQWTNTGSLTIQTQLRIDNGGTVSVAGAIQNNDQILIGGSGGTLIAPEGITNNGTFFISGTNSVIDGSVTNNLSMSTVRGRTLVITGDLTNSANRLDSGLKSQGTTRIEGSYNGGGIFDTIDQDGVVIVAGAYRPGDVNGPETGFVQFEGPSLQMESTTTTFIDLATAIDHDQIRAVTLSGDDGYGNTIFDHPDVTLAGDLQVNLLDGFTLDVGQSFQIIDFDSQEGTISGSFANAADGDVILSNNGFDLVIRYDFDGVNDDDGVYLETVSAAEPPANDAFASTIGTGAFPFNLTGTNIDATVEPGEQQLGNTGATVWWFFTAPADGMVTIDSFGSNFDTQLHIFDGFSKGATVADLNPVINNDDAGGTALSEVTFAVTASTCYEIRVGGFAFTNGSPAEGNIMLNGTFAPDGILMGDVNCDGMVDLLDVGPFVDLIVSGQFSAKADFNNNGAVDLLDVGPFVELITGI